MDLDICLKCRTECHELFLLFRLSCSKLPIEKARKNRKLCQQACHITVHFMPSKDRNQSKTSYKKFSGIFECDDDQNVSKSPLFCTHKDQIQKFSQVSASYRDESSHLSTEARDQNFLQFPFFYCRNSKFFDKFIGN